MTISFRKTETVFAFKGIKIKNAQDTIGAFPSGDGNYLGFPEREMKRISSYQGELGSRAVECHLIVTSALGCFLDQLPAAYPACFGYKRHKKRVSARSYI